METPSSKLSTIIVIRHVSCLVDGDEILIHQIIVLYSVQRPKRKKNEHLNEYVFVNQNYH